MAGRSNTQLQGNAKRKRVKGRCPLRGCRGGVSPCAGPGGSPGAAKKKIKKGTKKARVSEQLRSSLQWKRQVKSTPRDRASENGSRGDAPCAGAGAALAPAQVRAAARAQQKNTGKKGTEEAGVSGRDALHPAMETAEQVNSTGKRQRTRQMPKAVGARPHPISLRSATFPRGEGCARCCVGNGRFRIFSKDQRTKTAARTKHDAVRAAAYWSCTGVSGCPLGLHGACRFHCGCRHPPGNSGSFGV